MNSPHPIDVHVGKRLRLRRSIMGMSQDTIGKAIGVSFQQIQKYERGINRMGSSRLYEFSKLLEVPISYFFEEFDDPSSNAQPGMAESTPPTFEYEEQLSSRETMEMMRHYYNIPSKEVRKRIFELIKAVATQSND